MIDTLLYAGLSNALLATPLALCAALVGRVARRPALTHALWLLVLLKLVTPPLVPLAIPWPVPSPVPGPLPDAPTAHVILAVPLVVNETPQPDTAPVMLLPPTAAPVWTWQHGVLALWLSGALLYWTLIAVRVGRFRLLLRQAVPAEEFAQERARYFAARLGLRRCPRVLLLSAPLPPMLWAFFGPPRVLVPAALWQRLSAAQRDTLLLHELAHLRRGDTAVRHLELLVLGLYWWHPVAWWACRALAEAGEQCCDAWVVWALPQDAEAYATALVETVAFLSASRPALPAGASGIGHLQSLKRRLTMIVRGTPSRSLSRWGLLAVCLLGAALLPLVPLWGVSAPQPGPLFLIADEPAEPEDQDAQGVSFPVTLRGQSRSPWPTAASNELVRPPITRKQLEELQDEIELLQMQLRVKKVEQEAAAAHLQAAEARSKRLDQMAGRGVVSQAEIEKAQADLAAARTQLALKELAVREAEIRLRQPARRLEELQQSAKPPARGAAALFETRSHDFGSVAGNSRPAWSAQMTNSTKETFRISGVRVTDSAVTATPRSVELKPGEEGTVAVWIDPSRFTGAKTFQVWVHFSAPREEQVLLELRAKRDPAANVPAPPAKEDADRLRQLERRLEKLLQEAEELRRELRPKKTDASPVLQNDLRLIDKRNFILPFKFDETNRPAARVTHVTLWQTGDDGKTWQEVQTVRPESGRFALRDLADGRYGFSVTLRTEPGGDQPAPRPGDAPMMLVQVQVND